MKEHLRRAIVEAPKELRRALLVVAERKVEIVKDRVPVKDGDLRDSVRARVMVSGKKEDLRVTVIAGGPNVPYARFQHERHKTHSKFLESVILEARGTAAREISEEVSLRRMVQ
jgi:hypothetical protein